jgi:hypothetical protein
MNLVDKYLGESREILEKKESKDIEDRIKKAVIMGAKAFKDGLKSTPALNKKFMVLMKGLPVGGGATKILDAYTRAWHEANIKAK